MTARVSLLRPDIWFGGKVIAEPKVTLWVGELSCLKVNLSI
jgi:hypothetical protein